MSLPQRPPKVLILSSSPIYAGALQKLVEDSPTGWHSEVFLDPALMPPAAASPSDPVLVAPRDWQELGSWILLLQRRPPETPWVVVTDLRTVGLFLPALEAQPCLVVDTAGSPDELGTALRAAVSGDCWDLPTTLALRFMRSKGTRSKGRCARVPSLMELAVCCGVALGLSNPEIAGAHHVSEATVKTHLHRLMTRMDLESRTELGALTNRALAYQVEARETGASDLVLTL